MKRVSISILITQSLLLLFPADGITQTPITADFSASPRSGARPLEVTFTDQSTGSPITSWTWYFEGGTPSYKIGPGDHTVTYNDTGCFKVTLMIEGGATGLQTDSKTKYDYITVYDPPQRDFGDAPDDAIHHYATLLANDGAYHVISDSIYLGLSVDAEDDGQPDITAKGDDSKGNDEDGVVFPPLMVIGNTADIKVTAHGHGYLNAWFDFNRDGDWLDQNEHVFNAVPLSGGIHTLAMEIPHTADLDTSYARFRFSTDSNLPYAESAIDGEVEDYIIDFMSLLQAFESDSLALVAFYNNTDGPNWTVQTNWLTGPLATWHDVTVNNWRVTKLNIEAANDVDGPIPPEFWNLTKLDTLLIGSNGLTGTLPPDIGYLTNLKVIGIWGCTGITGSIPSEIGDLIQLGHLGLEDNGFTGNIPPEIWTMTNLKSLGLGVNYLTGTVSSNIGNLINLQHLSLYYNQFTGQIPATIGNLTNLKSMYLGENEFNGPIPDVFGSMSNLMTLCMEYNQLTGAVPVSFLNCSSMHTLWINDNQLSDLPNLSTLSNLNNLWIQNNQFTFEDIEPNIGIFNFIYSPQDSVGTEQTLNLNTGDALDLSVTVGGTANQYQWTRNTLTITGATSSNYWVNSATVADAGNYICEITNTIATALTLYSRPFHVIVDGQTGVEPLPQTAIPKTFALKQNYPNPFNPTTQIEYHLPEAGDVKIIVYNLEGREVCQLVNAKKSAGIYTVYWDGKDSLSRSVASGIYFYRIDVNTDNGRQPAFSQVKRMIYMK